MFNMLNEFQKHRPMIHAYLKGESVENYDDNGGALFGMSVGVFLLMFIVIVGIMKSNKQQVNPHASKEECDVLIEKNLVYGCCKPFRIYRGNSGDYEYVDVCDYI